MACPMPKILGNVLEIDQCNGYSFLGDTYSDSMTLFHSNLWFEDFIHQNIYAMNRALGGFVIHLCLNSSLPIILANQQ